MKHILIATLICMVWSKAFGDPPPNDNFANSDLLAGTNITYTGNFTTATSEPGEPLNNATNTVWAAWAAPSNGYVNFSMATAPQFQYCNVYMGSSVDQLQPVNLTGNKFMATEGVVYHFQFSGGADNFTFYLQFQPFSPCPNDNFTNALRLAGMNVSTPETCINWATMEPGEPEHFGDIPQKSAWWEWQAPLRGTLIMNPFGCLDTNFVLAVYSGNSLATLSLLGKATNGQLPVPVVDGQTYYLAVATPSNAVGDVQFSGEVLGVDYSSHAVPGNLLLEPSWEGTALNPQYWGKSGSFGGYVNQSYGGADGYTWPVLGSASSGVTAGAIRQVVHPLSQNHQYAITFAFKIGGNLSTGSGDAQVSVNWGNTVLGIADIPEAESGFWHWDTYTATAIVPNVTLSFSNLARNVEMDAFSVVDITAPPAIVTQPVSASSITGGTANFVVGASGTPPLTCQWFFNNQPLDSGTNQLLTLSPLTTDQSGNYQVVITNAFGAVTSSVASLAINAPDSATILYQPYGDTVSAGGYFNFSVVAAGNPPLFYQWFLNNQPVTGATNANLMLANVQATNAGAYTVEVTNLTSAVWSIPATLIVSQTATGGGLINFKNQNFFSGVTNVNVPVYDVDGTTLLNGSSYYAQLYAGPSLDQLRPAGQPAPFQEGFNAGVFIPETNVLANVAPGSNVFLQVCAWDTSYGSTYEQARCTGGKFGKSNILQVSAGGNGNPPQSLLGLQSFSLQAGLPYFEVGTISFVQRQPPNLLVWSLQGQAGSLYLIEKTTQLQDADWQPFMVITNVTGTMTFTDAADSGGGTAVYRARILN